MLDAVIIVLQLKSPIGDFNRASRIESPIGERNRTQSRVVAEACGRDLVELSLACARAHKSSIVCLAKDC